CGLDMLSCGPLERGEREDPLWTSRKLSARKLFVPDALRVQARTTADELRQMADVFAEKLNRATGPTLMMIPSRGLSSLSEEGRPLCDFEADAALTVRLKERLGGNVEVLEVNLPLNTKEFGEMAALELLRMMGVDREQFVGGVAAN
ncbi:MAG: UPF0261 family protein, partial [Deltaproteobacteria bacterium]|nr:UPF0261 family protein [Deltaproteobacteria bacterium]